MAHSDRFYIAKNQRQARAAADRLFEEVKQELHDFLSVPVEIEHIGATAVPDCLTKGDLDVVVRVQREDFQAVEAAFAARYEPNPGSTRTEEFAAFEDETRRPHLGLQLTAKGGAFDIFHHFVDALRANPELVMEYNALKLAHDGQPMDRYRAAKDAFIDQVLRNVSAKRKD